MPVAEASLFPGHAGVANCVGQWWLEAIRVGEGLSRMKNLPANVAGTP